MRWRSDFGAPTWKSAVRYRTDRSHDPRGKTATFVNRGFKQIL